MVAQKQLEKILAKIEQGYELTRNEAYQLGSISPESLIEMKRVAFHVRKQTFGHVMSYTQNCFIPLTNICKDYCSYCTFRKDPNDVNAKIMSPKEVLTVVREAKKMGCTEVLFSLGDKADYFLEVREWLQARGYRNMHEYLEAMCELVVRETGLLPHTNAGVIDSFHLKRLKRVNASMGLMLESISDRLNGPGQVHEKAPDKKPHRRLNHIRQAGELGIPFTTGILIGIGETWEERVDSLFAIRDLHQKYGHIQEVIIQNFKAKDDTPMSDSEEPSLQDLIRTICTAIFIFQGSIHIQVPPNLNATYLRELIQSGVDDWGGISPLTADYINPEAPWPHREKLEEITRSEGLILEQRLPIYPEYIKEEFIHPDLQSVIDQNFSELRYKEMKK